MDENRLRIKVLPRNSNVPETVKEPNGIAGFFNWLFSLFKSLFGQQEIQSIKPKSKTIKIKGKPKRQNGRTSLLASNINCNVCSNNFEDGEAIAKCRNGHQIHQVCVGIVRGRCPTCRSHIQ